MNPARAMGTFLRTWRSEWAGLSRAQLATAISALCPSGKRVTPFIIQEWEAGQPPKSTAELEGLCAVMLRNGLVEPEIADYVSNRPAGDVVAVGLVEPDFISGDEEKAQDGSKHDDEDAGRQAGWPRERAGGGAVAGKPRHCIP